MEGMKLGTKRKRFEAPQENASDRISGKLHHDLKEVRKSAKKAKIFEIQKLVKKLKALRKERPNDNGSVETEAQLEALKKIDHETVANTALKTRLNKDRLLSTNEYVQLAISKELDPNLLASAPQSTPSSKIQSRLLSSKILAAEITLTVEDLRNILQPKPDRDTRAPDEHSASTQIKKIKTAEQPEGEVVLSNQHRPETDGEQLNDEEDEAGWESGTVGGSDNEDGWESGSLAEEQRALKNEEDETPNSNKQDLNIAVSRKKTLKPPLLTSTKLPQRLTKAESTFLPSLSVGFTRGESDDSDLSESEAKIADIDLKKNRRGQRARRAIWEKKYGRNANHKKKEAEVPGQQIPKQYSSYVRDGEGYNQGASKRRPPERIVPQHRQKADSGWAQRVSEGQGKRVTPSRAQEKRADEKPMHPSWEAKRKLKEKESVGIVPSQGKKIKFS